MGWLAARSSRHHPGVPTHVCWGTPPPQRGPLPAQSLQMPPSSGGCRGAAWSFSASRLADAGVLKLPTSSGCWLEHEHALPSLCSVQQPSLPSLGDGRVCCRLLQQGLPACSPCPSPIPPRLMRASLLRDVLADSAESPPLASRLALCVCVCVCKHRRSSSCTGAARMVAKRSVDRQLQPSFS